MNGFLLILGQLDSYLSTIKVQKLTNFQKLLIVFMKLRLNLDYTDLSYRFDIHVSTISDLFKKVLICLHNTFEDLLYWPDRETLRTMMPTAFRVRFAIRLC